MAWTAKWALAGFLAQAIVAIASARASDPRLAAGRDPGGIAVAIVGAGLDYRRQELASRLARDGEGELIGWDFVDGDRLPFAASGGFDAIAAIVVGESGARAIPVRVGSDGGRQVAQALRLLGETPAHIVVVVARPANPIDRDNLAMAARQLPRMLIIVPAGIVRSNSTRRPFAADEAGLLIVAALGSATRPDLAVEGGRGAETAGAPGTPVAIDADDVAAARIGALAARLADQEPALTGAALRARLLRLARTGPDGTLVMPGPKQRP
ncbi:MAG: hypothetical protein AB7L90_08220 [Hyphomicrobiaceae bacterium]